ncbi:MAG: hypothetical protein OEX00_01260 [Gammaproteobacteria bacterium]|nr:hypothetical protein [Gammaproteobacteria bacterium]
MKKEQQETIEADKTFRKTIVILVLFYLLLLMWLEPIIDFALSWSPPPPDPTALAEYNSKKEFLFKFVSAVARSLPLVFFAWVGYQVLQNERLPPKNWRMPIRVTVIKGGQARSLGLLTIALCMLMLLRELALFT